MDVVGRRHGVHEEIEGVVDDAEDRWAVEELSGGVLGERLGFGPGFAAVGGASGADGCAAFEFEGGAVVPGGEEGAVEFDDGGLVEEGEVVVGAVDDGVFESGEDVELFGVEAGCGDGLEGEHVDEGLVFLSPVMRLHGGWVSVWGRVQARPVPKRSLGNI